MLDVSSLVPGTYLLETFTEMFEVSPDSLCSALRVKTVIQLHRSRTLVGFAAVVASFGLQGRYDRQQHWSQCP